MRLTCRSIIERVKEASRAWRAPTDIPHLLEQWVEERRPWDCAGWVLRGYPTYQFTFVESVRGQSIRGYLDFHAELGFLGLFLYWPGHISAGAVETLYPGINRINWECSVGCMELDPDNGVLRFRASIDTRGATLITGYLDRMLESGLHTLERHATKLLTGPTGLVAQS